MKPRVFSQEWRDVRSGETGRRWVVRFEDSCGCVEESDFATATTALQFALHVAGGGSRWEFVEERPCLPPLAQGRIGLVGDPWCAA